MSAGRPRLWRLATRNISRRPAEATTVVLGAMLGTAVIVAAFVIGDSFASSIRDIARTSLGPIDEQIQIRAGGTDEPLRALAELADHIRHSPPSGTDGLLSSTFAPVVLTNGRDGDALETLSAACALELDLADGRRFGGDPAETGLADLGSNPTGREVILNDAAARHLGVRVGDPVELAVYGARRTLTVRTVARRVGVAGRCDAILVEGTLAGLYAERPASTADAQPPAGQLLISNTGDTFEGAARTDEVMPQLEALVDADAHAAGLAEVRAVKQELLDASERQGSNLRTIFSGIGGFSVVSGVLLLVNLFVMLAEERKVSLGIMRAIGTKRRHVWAGFCIEGALYAAGAAVIGATAGIGVGWLVVVATRRVLQRPDDDFVVSLSVKPASIVLAAAIGLAIALVTVAATSARIARLNVIAAVRDLPPPPRRRTSHRRRLLLVVVAASGLATLAGGPSVGLIAGVPIAVAALSGLLTSPRERDLGLALSGAVAIAWPLSSFAIFPSRLDRAGIAVFVVMGLVLVAGAVGLIVGSDRLLRFLSGRLAAGGRGLAIRLGLAYPLARRMRTGLLCGMFSLVVFTLVFLASFAGILSTQRDTAARDMSAGTQLLVRSNRSNPLSAEQLRGVEGVNSVAVTTRGGPNWVAERYQSEPTRWPVSGIDRTFLALGVPALASRSPRFASDREAFEAVLTDPALIIVNEQFLVRGDGPRDDGPRPDDRVTLIEPTGARHDLTVVGVMRSDFVAAGSFVQVDALRGWLGVQLVANQAYVAIAPGRDASTVADTITRDFIDNGAEAKPFEAFVDEGLRQTRGFIALLQGYLAVGLLIGIAGLGVVMVRAVHERRREIGMLRAMGAPARVIGTAFFVEALLITVTSIAIGILLGLVTVWQVVVNSTTFSTAAVRFVVPWGSLWWIALAPLLGALAATMIPARRATRVRPVTALRTAD